MPEGHQAFVALYKNGQLKMTSMSHQSESSPFRNVAANFWVKAAGGADAEISFAKYIKWGRKQI